MARCQRLQIDSLLFDWELREEFNNVGQGMIFVTAQVCQGLNERKMDAREQHPHLYGSSQHAFLTCQFNEE